MKSDAALTMVEKTPRLNLNNYEEGESGWDHSDTVEAVDEFAVQKGPISERPDSGNYDDELYYATDQSVLWGWDESKNDWTIRGGLGSDDQSLPKIHADLVKSDGILAGKEPPTLPDGPTPPIYANAVERGLGIALQQTDDSPGADGAVPHIRWFSSKGERIAQLKAHAPHNHFSLYLRDRPLDGTTGSWHKRLDVSSAGDSEAGEVSWRRTDRWEVENKHGSTSLRLSSGNGEHSTIQWGQEGESETQDYSLIHRPGKGGEFKLRDKYNDRDVFRYKPSADPPIWDLAPGDTIPKVIQQQSGGVSSDDLPVGGLLWDKDSSRLVFKEDSETCHYFEPDGTL